MSLPANVCDAAQRGDVILAIKLLRESTGLGLKEAKDAVERYRRGDAVAVEQAPADHALPVAVLEAVRLGRKIEAIKLLRESTGLGLKQAKDAVERHAAASPDQVWRPEDDSSTAGPLRWMVLIVPIGLVAWWFLHRAS